MNHRCAGIICQLAGIAAAVCGLVPGAILLNPWRSSLTVEQWEVAYSEANRIKCAVIALAGLAAGYVLLRLGSHLKSKCSGGS